MPFLSAEAKPTDAEKAVYEKVAVVLERAPRIIDEMGGYTGAGEQIREVSFKVFLLMLTYLLNCVVDFYHKCEWTITPEYMLHCITILQAAFTKQIEILLKYVASYGCACVCTLPCTCGYAHYTCAHTTLYRWGDILQNHKRSSSWCACCTCTVTSVLLLR